VLSKGNENERERRKMGEKKINNNTGVGGGGGIAQVLGGETCLEVPDEKRKSRREEEGEKRVSVRQKETSCGNERPGDLYNSAARRKGQL